MKHLTFLLLLGFLLGLGTLLTNQLTKQTMNLSEAAWKCVRHHNVEGYDAGFEGPCRNIRERLEAADAVDRAKTADTDLKDVEAFLSHEGKAHD